MTTEEICCCVDYFEAWCRIVGLGIYFDDSAYLVLLSCVAYFDPVLFLLN